MEQYDIPELSEEEMTPLEGLRQEKPREFYTNVKESFKKTLLECVYKRIIFRVSIMGLPRAGKSEVGHSLAFWHVNATNHAIETGAYEDLKIYFGDGTMMPLEPVKFTTDNVTDNQMVYKQEIQDRYREKTLRFGQIWVIDESKKSIGGMGSMSEMIETRNINDITAKFGQSEIWITPTHLQARNTSFGLYVKKKDYVNRKNWCLVYLPVQQPNGITTFQFIGWMDIALHHDEEFRAAYERKKDGWIGEVLAGGGDPRDQQRGKAAKVLYEGHPHLFRMNDNGRFMMSRNKRVVMLKRMIRQGELQNFNEAEQTSIAEEAEMIAMDEAAQQGEQGE